VTLAVRAAAGAIGLLTLIGATPAATPAAFQAWLTTGDGTRLMAPVAASAPAPDAITVTVDPARRFQTMVGFGAAITDASAIVLTRMKPDQRAALMRELFGNGPGALHLSFTRLTIGASDFSPTHYSLDDPPGNAADPMLRYFSIAPNRQAMLPVVQQARAINPQLVVMASPWSPPGWMKTGGSMIGGTLKPDLYPVYARYLVRWTKAYVDAGVPLRYLTIQNEPGFEPKDYPGMLWPAAGRARFIADDLGPALAAARLPTRILDWDHNWDHPEEPLGVLGDAGARRYVAGVAWHCYGGDVSAQSPVHDAYPDKDAFLTECSGGEWNPGWKNGFGDVVHNLLIGSVRNWSRGVILWNLVLDPQRGPHKGGCDTCRGVVTVDPGTGAVTRNPEYYALAHVSRFVHSGAQRIASDAPAGSAIESVAFRNGDDGSVVVLIHNLADATHPVVVKIGDAAMRLTLPGGAAVTVRLARSAKARL